MFMHAINYLCSAQSQGGDAVEHMGNGEDEDEYMEMVNRIRRHKSNFSLQPKYPTKSTLAS